MSRFKSKIFQSLWDYTRELAFDPDDTDRDMLQIYIANIQAIQEVIEAATDLLDHRQEISSHGIWYVEGAKGKRLLKALGIEYVEKL